MVTRGVLVDIARDQGVKRLAGDHLVTVEDIETAARHEGLSFHQGDVVFIRTGWMSIWYEQGKNAFISSGSPGIGWGVSQWLKENRAAAVGVDTVNEEILPCEPKAQQMIHQPKWPMPIHYELIRNQGMMLMDLSYLDELAEACARDHVYEFLFIGGALNIINGTGSPACPLAIK
jgi:kynurenine formamidase